MLLYNFVRGITILRPWENNNITVIIIAEAHNYN